MKLLERRFHNTRASGKIRARIYEHWTKFRMTSNGMRMLCIIANELETTAYTPGSIVYHESVDLNARPGRAINSLIHDSLWMHYEKECPVNRH